MCLAANRMLCGVKELFVFEWNGTHFVPNSDIRVSHLTDVCAAVRFASHTNCWMCV